MSIQAVQIRITFATLGTRIHVYSNVHIFMQPWLIIMRMLSDIIPIIFSLYLNRTFTCITVTITFIQKTNLLMLLQRISVSICSHCTPCNYHHNYPESTGAHKLNRKFQKWENWFKNNTHYIRTLADNNELTYYQRDSLEQKANLWPRLNRQKSLSL